MTDPIRVIHGVATDLGFAIEAIEISVLIGGAKVTLDADIFNGGEEAVVALVRKEMAECNSHRQSKAGTTMTISTAELRALAESK